MWLHGKRVLWLKNLSDGSAEIADKGQIITVGPQLERAAGDRLTASKAAGQAG